MGANSVGQLREDLRREQQKLQKAEERHKAALADLHEGASETERRLKERIAQLMAQNADLAERAEKAARVDDLEQALMVAEDVITAMRKRIAKAEPEASRAADLRAQLLQAKAEAAAMHGRLIVTQRALDEERRKPPQVVDRPVLTADARGRIAFLENEVSVLQSRLREIGE